MANMSTGRSMRARSRVAHAAAWLTITATCGLAPLAQAAIITLGDVAPDPGGGVVSGVLTVGPSTGGTGSVTVEGGSGLTVGNLGIANNSPSGNGTVVVRGAGSTLRNTHTSPGSMNIGGTGIGRLHVLDGAAVTFDARITDCASGCSTFVTNGAGSTGEMLISGVGSLFDSRTAVVVGHRSVFTVATDGFDYGTRGGTSNGTLRVEAGGTGRSNSMTIGSPGTGNGRTAAEQANGIAVIDGTGSSWTLTREASSGGDLAALFISSGSQTRGDMTVSGGGLLRLDGSTAPDSFFGISMGSGGSTSSGRLAVTGAASRVLMTGGTGFMNIGNSVGGTGVVEVTSGGVIEGSGDRGLTSINVGRRGGDGTLSVSGADAAGNASSLLIAGRGAAGTAPALLNVGRFESGAASRGTVEVRAGGQIRIDASADATTTATSTSLPGLLLGHAGSGAVGAMTIDGRNAVTGDASRVSILGGTGMNPLIAVGRDGGTGSLTISGGAQFVVTSNHESAPTAPGGTGYATGEGVFLQIGRRNVAGTEASEGTVTVTGAGSALVFSGIGDSIVQLGTGANARGTLNVSAGGSVTANAITLGGSAASPSGRGTLNIDGGTVHAGGVMRGGPAPGQGGGVSIGRFGADGEAHLTGGARLLIDAAVPGPALVIGGSRNPGAGGGAGLLTVSGASFVEVSGAGGLIGVGWASGDAGRGIGDLSVTGLGSRVAATGAGAQIVIAGDARTNGLAYVGPGASLISADLIGVAHDGTTSTGGAGMLFVDGLARAQTCAIGTTGLMGGTGVYVCDAFVRGILSPGRSPGRLTLNGALDSDGGRILLEVQALAGGGYAVDELLLLDPDRVSLGHVGIEFSFLGDTDPNAFFAAGLFEVASFFKVDDGAGGVRGIGPERFDWFDAANFSARSDRYRFDSFSFTAADGAHFSAVAIPAPASLALALMALGSLCGVRRRTIRSGARSSTLLALATLISGSASAQTPAPMHGKWAGTAKSQGGAELAVELLLAETGSSWRFVRQGSQGRNNPCLDKDFPVIVLSQSATDLSIKIDGSKVLQGCLDQTAAFKTADGKSLDGTLGDGRPVSLSRK